MILDIYGSKRRATRVANMFLEELSVVRVIRELTELSGWAVPIERGLKTVARPLVVFS
jgi:hypothetical protein